MRRKARQKRKILTQTASSSSNARGAGGHAKTCCVYLECIKCCARPSNPLVALLAAAKPVVPKKRKYCRHVLRPSQRCYCAWWCGRSLRRDRNDALPCALRVVIVSLESDEGCVVVVVVVGTRDGSRDKLLLRGFNMDCPRAEKLSG